MLRALTREFKDKLKLMEIHLDQLEVGVGAAYMCICVYRTYMGHLISINSFMCLHRFTDALQYDVIYTHIIYICLYICTLCYICTYDILNIHIYLFIQ